MNLFRDELSPFRSELNKWEGKWETVDATVNDTASSVREVVSGLLDFSGRCVQLLEYAYSDYRELNDLLEKCIRDGVSLSDAEHGVRTKQGYSTLTATECAKLVRLLKKKQ